MAKISNVIVLILGFLSLVWVCVSFYRTSSPFTPSRPSQSASNAASNEFLSKGSPKDWYHRLRYEKVVDSFGIERSMPIVPTGPQSELYKNHLYLDVDFKLVLDSSRQYFSFPGMKLSTWADTALRYRAAWLARVQEFRKLLVQEGFNNVDDEISLENAPFRKVDDSYPEIKHPLELNGNYTWASRPPKPDFNKRPGEVPAEEESRQHFAHCVESPEECGAVQTPVVVDMGVVLPLNIHRFNNSWPTLESIRQLVVFPKEIVFVIGGFAVAENQADIFSYINVIRELYGNFLPPGCSIQVYLSDYFYKPGENRWFGFNQTTAPVVLMFDGDDYMHPQLIQAIWESFSARPELDYALFMYEGGEMEGQYRGDFFYYPIIQFLRRRRYRAKDLKKMTEYSNDAYVKIRRDLPTWDKHWYLGNTDAEPNWGGEEQRWWDYSCHNGWVTLRRHVLDRVFPPTDYFGGEDAIFNYRVARAGFNYHCFGEVLGVYLKCFCEGKQQLWAPEDLEES